MNNRIDMIYYKVTKSVLHDNNIRSLRYYNVDIFIYVKSSIKDSVIRKYDR
jgi:hypothetical protein